MHIQVYGEDDLTVESRVDGDGNINFPLLGIVSVAGKTSQEDAPSEIPGPEAVVVGRQEQADREPVG